MAHFVASPKIRPASNHVHFWAKMTMYVLLAPCKGIRIPESTNFSVLESGILALESGILL